jgi:hypothetical protein
MTERDFISLASAWARHATDEQRGRGANFLGAMSAEPEAAECAHEAHERNLRERQFEESQLSGLDLSRRNREPA